MVKSLSPLLYRYSRAPSAYNRYRLAQPVANSFPAPAVSELPLNKRDFSQLLLLAAGTMTDANGATNFTAAVRHQRPARR